MSSISSLMIDNNSPSGSVSDCVFCVLYFVNLTSFFNIIYKDSPRIEILPSPESVGIIIIIIMAVFI